MALLMRLYIQAKEAARGLGEDENGATAIEYGLIAALIAVGLIATLTAIGGELDTVFGYVQDALSGVDAPDTSGNSNSGG